MSMKPVTSSFACFAFALVLLLFPTFAIGQDLTPELDEMRRVGWEAVYNLDFATARAKFVELQQRAPQHPAGDMMMASLVWLEHLNRNRRLQINLYRSAGFYAGAKPGKDTGNDPIPSEIDKEFRQNIAQAINKAQTLVATNPRDAKAVYFLGSAYGLLAGYEASAARKFFSAMRGGKKSIEYLERAVKLAPELHDAYMAIGLFDYVIGSLPGIYRFFAFFGGFSGNKKKGINELRLVVEKGKYNRNDAALMLIGVYEQEGKFEDALALLQSLSLKFPRNYLLKLEAASIFTNLRRFDEAVAIYESLLTEQSSYNADLIRFQYGETLATKGDYAAGISQFLAITTIPGAEDSLVTRAHLRAGQMYDLAGAREEAVVQYNIVLSRPNVFDSREQAQRGLKRPYK